MPVFLGVVYLSAYLLTPEERSATPESLLKPYLDALIGLPTAQGIESAPPPQPPLFQLFYNQHIPPDFPTPTSSDVHVIHSEPTRVAHLTETADAAAKEFQRVFVRIVGDTDYWRPPPEQNLEQADLD